MFDNLGSLYQKLNDPKQAETYFLKSINLPNDDASGIRIPPYLKLAALYIKNKQQNQAIATLKEAKFLLNKYKEQNPTSYVGYYKEYANYFFAFGKLDSAYFYLNRHIAVKDSSEKSYQEIKTFDINKELKMLSEQRELDKLKHNDQVRRIYVVGLIEFIVLIFIIIGIIYFNLRKLKKIHQETLEKNQVITSTIDELERANKNYIRIMRIMAHDLRNPLSGMTGLAAAILDEDDFDAETRKMLKLIETTGLHSIEMINELLKTGLANESDTLEVQKIDLKSLLYDSVELLQFKAKEKQQIIIFENEEKDDLPIFTKVNYEKTWRVINNLIVNAIKFSYLGGEIRTGIKVYNTSIVIYVKDNGIGIADKNKETIFEMFTEAKRVGTNGEQPFGLGLSISKKIMEKHNGKIWFENADNGGTIFYLEFPKI
ncbi:tetratricopeptide repeat-containing sensor histidine kinase [Pedobacter alpinus]|uniref:histidine kinase n=1 Tax=Pedobacter alpinus TaxID=1590643 RepID=A0ABW5TQC8_9SPHI